MGRGETQDRFSQVLGTRRGSSAAQRARDRDEAKAAIASRITKDGPLDPERFWQLTPLLESGDAEIEKEVSAAVLANLRRNGLATVSLALCSPRCDISAAAQGLVRATCVEYISSEGEDSSLKREHLRSFVEDLFTGLSLRPSSYVKADRPLIEAISRLYEGERRARRDTRAQLFRFLAISAASQPKARLPLFSSWRDALVRAVEDGDYSPVAMRDFRESMATYSLDAQAFLAPLAEALDERLGSPPQS